MSVPIIDTAEEVRVAKRCPYCHQRVIDMVAGTQFTGKIYIKCQRCHNELEIDLSKWSELKYRTAPGVRIVSAIQIYGLFLKNGCSFPNPHQSAS